MKHDASQHWLQADTIREAASELDRIDRYESALVDYEQFVANQTDTLERIRSLLDLTTFYHREFGVHFEKRHAYRDQLNRVLVGDLETIDDARSQARMRYAKLFGAGLPRTIELAGAGETWNRPNENGNPRGNRNRSDHRAAASR